MINIISYLLIYVGLVIMFIGSIGIARLPDIYARLQASGASDTVGVVLILVGFLIRDGLKLSDSFLGLMAVFFFVTGPIVTHSIAKSAFLSKIEPSQARDEGEDV